ncbi:hypothetical protein MRX96_037187 [Rhipicephalus microplus]
MFPFAADDAHIGVLAGGIGQRLTATVFYQLVEQSGEAAAWMTYEQNHQCLGLERSEVDSDLPDAVAAEPEPVGCKKALRRRTREIKARIRKYLHGSHPQKGLRHHSYHRYEPALHPKTRNRPDEMNKWELSAVGK